MNSKGWEIFDLKNAMLVSTFFFLWLAVYFSDRVEETLGFLLILSFGILHGSNDLELLKRKTALGRGGPSHLRLLLAYIGFVLAIGVMFSLTPLFALALFVLISAYHFGEQHWVRRIGIHNWLQKTLYLSYGLLVLSLMFQAHPQEVVEVIRQIGGREIPAGYFGWSSLVLFLVFLASALGNYYRAQASRYLVREVFLLGVFFVVFHTASLLWAFAIYFVVWHSIPSLADQIRILYGQFSLDNGKKYLKASLVYWLGALATLGLAFLYFSHGDYGLLPIFFSFLAAITFPHVLVIARLYKG